MYQYQLTAPALKDIKRLDKLTQARIISKLNFLVATGNPLFFAHKLTDSDFGKYRFRVGSYRILFDLEAHTLVIHAIGHHRDIYR